MKQSTNNIIRDLINRYPILKKTERSIKESINAIIDCYKKNGKLLICGNGGSAADSLHIVGELMKDFVLPRPLPEEIKLKLLKLGENGKYINDNLQAAFPAIALIGSASLESAYANDRVSDLAFAQQVYGYGNKGDILIGISTSGNSKNIIYAIHVARVKGMKIIALTGATGGKMKDKCDFLINVPEVETYKIQELHLPVYHAVCLAVENEFFGL